MDNGDFESGTTNWGTLPSTNNWSITDNGGSNDYGFYLCDPSSLIDDDHSSIVNTVDFTEYEFTEWDYNLDYDYWFTWARGAYWECEAYAFSGYFTKEFNLAECDELGCPLEVEIDETFSGSIVDPSEYFGFYLLCTEPPMPSPAFPAEFLENQTVLFTTDDHSLEITELEESSGSGRRYEGKEYKSMLTLSGPNGFLIKVEYVDGTKDTIKVLY